MTQCGLRALAPALLILLWACAQGGETGALRPDVDKIVVYYPIDGVVHGRGYAGAIPAGDVQIRAPRTDQVGRVSRTDDGGFRFSIVAKEGDALEIRAGEALAFVEIPIPDEVIEHTCCGAGAGSGGTCTPVEAVRMGGDCTPSSMINECQVDSDCAFFENRTLFLDPSAFDISPPDASGQIRVLGQVHSRGLVIADNRGLLAYGRGPARSRQIVIAEENGQFELTMPAAGDDELVFTLRDLRGDYSHAGARLVPDPSLAGVDVVAALPWEPLQEGQRGKIALLVSPWGEDGAGLCPDQPGLDPVLCVSGGLVHADLSIEEVTINDAEKAAVDPQPSVGAPAQILGAAPDVRAGPRDVVVVLDMSANASAKELGGAPRRHAELANFVDNLRQRDRVGLITYGASAPVPLVEVEQRNQVLEALEQLETVQPEGPASLYDAVGQALDMLLGAQHREGHIIVVAADAPPQAPDEARARALALAQRAKTMDPPVLIDVIGIDLAQQASAGLSQLTGFTAAVRAGQPVAGRYVNIEDIYQLGQELVELRARLFGGFILLYEMSLPGDADKRDCISLEVRLTLRDAANVAIEKTDRYMAPLTVTNSPGEASLCRVAP